jgi:uncharacterized protein (DUF1684 family)
VTELDEFRAEKDAFYCEDPHSPPQPQQRASFEGLSYYPENEALRIRARLETEGVDRYLDIEPPGSDGLVLVDLNLAYNPNCAYNPEWSCPIPPGENWLAVPIRAGRRRSRVPTKSSSRLRRSDYTHVQWTSAS